MEKIKFKKMVAIEPTKLLPEWNERLKGYAEESTFYSDIPKNNEAIIERIGDADCVMLSFTSAIDQEVLDACPTIRYIGMCCSLYSPESANVDIRVAQKKGIVVTGIRDYGDEGVREYVISELVRLLQGRGEVMWKDEPMELTGVKVGLIGMGTVGSLVAEALHFFGADVSYYSRTRKSELEDRLSMDYYLLNDLVTHVDIVITALNKNVVLLKQEQFERMGEGKILMNLSIAPSHEIQALKQWLQLPNTFAFCDTAAGIGEEVIGLNNVFAGKHSAGLTSMAKVRLAQKVIQNIEAFLNEEGQA
ncbi:D-glycerate dehydrogenase [Enterococcus florum]|uniref:D-glycerate dehydrogenase n=1 Tax=Enterococcus florum TaxID=2480627 RepID=A0A4P5PGT0_9ENTE|nr:NAD(P)-dependent oxidoreductase [Enterococcus florum]GCF95641.1 D-glycerate dehydrogenase [Enterococcus florum]